MTNGEPLTVKSPDSKITLEVPRGLKAVIMQHIHTDYEELDKSIPPHECIVSPAVHFIVKNRKYEESKEFIIKAKIPHCLPGGYDVSLLKVRLGNLSKKSFLKEVQRGKPQSPNTPYYTADKKYIILYTSHFCEVVCTSSEKICDSALTILSLGHLDQARDENLTMAKVKVFLCSHLLNRQQVLEVSWSNYCFLKTILPVTKYKHVSFLPFQVWQMVHAFSHESRICKYKQRNTLIPHCRI